MWKIDYDAGTAAPVGSTAASTATNARNIAYPMPAPPKRRMPPMLAAILGFIACAMVIFVWEAFAPEKARLSSNLGALSERLNEAEKRGEIRGATEAQYAYELKMKALELDLQSKLAMVEVAKQAEIVAAQGRVNAALENYRALYDQARVMAETGAAALNQLRSIRASQSRDSYSGRTSLVNLADMFAPFVRMAGYADAAQSMRDWASATREETMAAISTDVMNTPDIASVWMNRIPSPAEVEARIKGPGVPNVKLDTAAPALPAPRTTKE